MQLGNLEHRDGALTRAYSRRLATVLSITGSVHAGNVEELTAWARTRVLDDDVILDLGGLDGVAHCDRLVDAVRQACAAARVEFAVVASDEVTEAGGVDASTCAVARSVPEALRFFADVSSSRRDVLLPLLGRTA